VIYRVALVSGLLLATLLGCSGGPFRFRILAYHVSATELPYTGGKIRVEVEATQGDRAEVKVYRKLGEQGVFQFTVRLHPVSAIDFEKRRWKGEVELPRNNTSEDQLYVLVISVRNKDEVDERLVEVIIRKPPTNNP